MGLRTGSTDTATPRRIFVVTAAAYVNTTAGSKEYTWSTAFSVTHRSRNPRASARWATSRTAVMSIESGERCGRDIRSEMFMSVILQSFASRRSDASTAQHGAGQQGRDTPG